MTGIVTAFLLRISFLFLIIILSNDSSLLESSSGTSTVYVGVGCSGVGYSGERGASKLLSCIDSSTTSSLFGVIGLLVC